MIYDIRHVTTYSYESSVSFARCTLRLMPSDTSGQRVMTSELEVAPQPASRVTRKSFFGHTNVAVTIETLHRELRIVATSRVDVDREACFPEDGGPAWEGVRDLVPASRSLAAASPAHYIYPSRLVSHFEPISEYARQSFPDDRGIADGARDLMTRIRSDFTYDRKATLVSTPLDKAFAMRRGVCQDFAHVMIAGLRGIGLPAAYVSGYLRTIPAKGAKRLEGADATHAWVAVWCGPEGGWIGFDPTNALVVTNDHIVLATGRDYADISPIDGVLVGSGSQKINVGVDVIPLE